MTTEQVDCYGLVNSSVTMNCSYSGNNAKDIGGSYWEIRNSRGALLSTVSERNPVVGFAFFSMSNFTSLTINQVSETLDASTIQCFFAFLFAQPEAGSGKIQVLVGGT